MKTVLKLEEAAMFILSIFFFNQLQFSWWWYPVLLLTPDLSMQGYLINTKVGAVAYNVAHHKGVAIGFWLVGFKLANEPMMFAGILLFGHSSFDRLFGYGLKYEDDFKHTHLGWLPGEKKQTLK